MRDTSLLSNSHLKYIRKTGHAIRTKEDEMRVQIQGRMEQRKSPSQSEESGNKRPVLEGDKKRAKKRWKFS